MRIKIKRIYEDCIKSDGFRVLTDRLWPRGVSKEAAAIDLWFKDAAPSTELRQWFGHDPDRWEEFADRYRVELSANAAPVGELIESARKSGHGVLTLLYAAKDEAHNQAVVLGEVLRTELG